MKLTSKIPGNLGLVLDIILKWITVPGRNYHYPALPAAFVSPHLLRPHRNRSLFF